MEWEASEDAGLTVLSNTDLITTTAIIGSFIIGISSSVLILVRSDSRIGGIRTTLTPTMITLTTTRITTLRPCMTSGFGKISPGVQSELARRGYYHGQINGVIDSDTRQAIRAFQKAQGLPVTGLINPGVLRALKLPIPQVLSRSSQNARGY